MIRSRALVLTALVVLTISTGAACAEYKIDWSVVSCGGGCSSSASYSANGTVGQPVEGVSNAVDLLHWTGFWSGVIHIPVRMPSVSSVKELADGALVSLEGKIATSQIGDFSDFFYIEESNRSCGIRVATLPKLVAGLTRGSVVDVVGTLGTTANGERQLVDPVAVVVSTTAPLEPVGMPNWSLGGATFGEEPFGQQGVIGGKGLNNVGLLVKTWGQVTSLRYMYAVVDDGSGPVLMDLTTMPSPPEPNSYVSVVGISSLVKSDTGYVKVILPRGDDDMSSW